jgi:hypothetical protein
MGRSFGAVDIVVTGQLREANEGMEDEERREEAQEESLPSF